MLLFLFWIQSIFGQIEVPYATGAPGSQLGYFNGRQMFGGEWVGSSNSDGWARLFGVTDAKLSFAPVAGDTLRGAFKYNNSNFGTFTQLNAANIDVTVNEVTVAANIQISADSLFIVVPLKGNPTSCFVDITISQTQIFFYVRGEISGVKIKGNDKTYKENYFLQCTDVATPNSLTTQGHRYLGGYHEQKFNNSLVFGNTDLSSITTFGIETFRLWFEDEAGSVYERRIEMIRQEQLIADTVAICPLEPVTGLQSNIVLELYGESSPGAGDWNVIGNVLPGSLPNLLQAGMRYRIVQRYLNGFCPFRTETIVNVKATYALSVAQICDGVTLTVPGCTDCQWSIDNGTPFEADSLVLRNADGAANVSVQSNTDTDCFWADYRFTGTPYVPVFGYIQTCGDITVTIPPELELLADSSIVVVYGTDTIVHNVRTLSIAYDPSITRIELRGKLCDSKYTAVFVPSPLGPECGGPATLLVTTDPCGNAQITSNQAEVEIRKAGTTGSKIVAEADVSGDFVPLALDPGSYQFTAGSGPNTATQTLIVEAEEVFNISSIVRFITYTYSIRMIIDTNLLPIGTDSIQVFVDGIPIGLEYDLDFQQKLDLTIVFYNACGSISRTIMMPDLVCNGTNLSYNPVNTDPSQAAQMGESFVAYPNELPAGQDLNIKLPTGRKATNVTIIRANGIEVANYEPPQTETFVIPASNFAVPGLYVLQTTLDNNRVFINRIIKQ